MPVGAEILLLLKALTAPAVVIRPIELCETLVNQRAPSGPAVMPLTPEILASAKSVTVPAVVIRPIAP